MDVLAVLGIFLGLWILVSPFVSISSLMRISKLEQRIRQLEWDLKHVGDGNRKMVSPLEPKPDPLPVDMSQAPPIPRRELFKKKTVQQPSLEEMISSRWMVWLGALTLALGGVFLVRYSIEQNIITPLLRVSGGFCGGVLIIAVAEFLRRLWMREKREGLNRITTGLTAGGLSLMFSSVYAAYGLYALIHPATAFILMAATVYAGILLSLNHGQLVAVLGLLGGTALPYMVASGEPNGVAMFGYLFLLVAGCLLTGYYRRWPLLAWLTLAASTFWSCVWMGQPHMPDSAALGTYLVLVCGLFIYIPHGFGLTEDDYIRETKQSRYGILNVFSLMRRDIIWAASAVMSVLMFFFVLHENYAINSLFFAGALGALFYYTAFNVKHLDGLALLGTGFLMLVLGRWDATIPLHVKPSFDVLKGNIPTDFTLYQMIMAATSLFVFLWGFICAPTGRRPAVWTSISATVPVFLLGAAYYWLGKMEVDMNWGLAAASLALGNWMLVEFLAKEKSWALAKFEAAKVPYIVASFAALALACTMVAREAWLTIALSALIPALGFVYQRMPFAILRLMGLLLAWTVLARLLINFHILEYPFTGWPILNWITYGYGLPALSFLTGAWLMRGKKDDILEQTLVGGAIAFIAVMVSMHIRHLANGGVLNAQRYDLFEQAMHTISWLVMAWVLFLMAERHNRKILIYGWRTLFWLAVAQIILLQSLFSNPYFRNTNLVVAWPVVNDLLFAYGIPALFMGVFSHIATRRGMMTKANALAALAVFLGFEYVTLEVRHTFHGANLYHTALITDGEIYAYSAAWLLTTLTTLGVAVWKKLPSLRYASLALMLLTVGKVFFYDMSQLVGLYRALSFLGLGLVMILVGYVYQRFVFVKEC